jgi:hypothetical protein
MNSLAEICTEEQVWRLRALDSPTGTFTQLTAESTRCPTKHHQDTWAGKKSYTASQRNNQPIPPAVIWMPLCGQ